MENNKMDKRFDKLKEATIKYYSGEPYTGLTDLQYDQLRREYYNVYGVDILDDIDYPSQGDLPHSEDIFVLPKISVEGDLTPVIKEHVSDEYFLLPKYDGCSIVVYYYNGLLKSILTKSRSDFGVDQTNKLKSFVPREVDPEITSIQCEALVSLSEGLGGNTRNKANGLINSKYLQDEVNYYLSLRAFRINYKDKKYDYKRLKEGLLNLPVLYKDNGSIKFSHGAFLDINNLPTTDELNLGTDEHFLVDGVVALTPESVQGFKFYYTESCITEITDITWGVSALEGFTPVAQFDPITLQGKSVQRCSFNGVSSMQTLKAGIGSTVKVILSNSTIPQIIEVLEPSTDFNYPTCGCGTVLNEDSQIGPVLKCLNTECTEKLFNRLNMIWFDPDVTKCNSYEDYIQVFKDYLIWFTGDLLIVDRFKPENNFNDNLDKSEVADKFLKLIFEESMTQEELDKEFDELYGVCYSMSDKGWEIWEINYRSAMKAIKLIANRYKVIQESPELLTYDRGLLNSAFLSIELPNYIPEELDFNSKDLEIINEIKQLKLNKLK